MTLWLAAAVAAIAVGTTWLGGAAALVAFGRRRGDDVLVDAIVVPGAAVLRDGSPSPALRRRIEAAAALYRAGRAPRVVVSGGVVRHPPSEAEVGAALLAALGVPEGAIVREVEARTTRENASRAAALGVGRRIVVVTDDFHAARCHVWFGAHFDGVYVHGVPTRRALRRALPEALKALVAVVRARRSGPSGR